MVMAATQMCYRRDFLSGVICRVDYPMMELSLEARDKFAAKIAERFPHTSSVPLRETSVNLTDAGGDVVHRDIGRQYTHRKTVDGTVALTIGPQALSLNLGPADYTSFADFFVDFSFALQAAIDAFSIAEFTRVGLRYVNEIRLPGRALDWAGIINERLLPAVLAPALEGGRMLRSMHQVCDLHDDDQVLLTYGLVNPDFPAPLVQRHFILDIDSSRDYVLKRDEVEGCVRTLNQLCADTFESCIGNGLREKMETADE